MHKETEVDYVPFEFLANLLEFQPPAVPVVSCAGGPSQPASCCAQLGDLWLCPAFPTGDLRGRFCRHKDDLICWWQIMFSKVSRGPHLACIAAT